MAGILYEIANSLEAQDIDFKPRAYRRTARNIEALTDGDPWSYRIFGSVSYGSIKTAHLSRYLATPDAIPIGIQPEDILEYDLPTDPLSDSDINALENELEDPRFQSDY